MKKCSMSLPFPGSSVTVKGPLAVVLATSFTHKYPGFPLLGLYPEHCSVFVLTGSAGLCFHCGLSGRNGTAK
jgi:hypothetical protein